MKRVLISGSSGFIGQALSKHLESKGYAVTKLVRNKAPGPDQIVWNPETGAADLKDLEGFDAIVHLAGDHFTLGRWSKAKKEAVRKSRADGTLHLAELLARCSKPPSVFLSASGIGFYGDCGDEWLTEQHGIGKGFLAAVCSDWEKGSKVLEKRGIRTVQTRFAIAIGPNGGVVKDMLPSFKMGMGGKMGTGKQWVSWIALEDLLRAIEFLISHSEVKGPVNVASPQPIRQEDFAKTFAELLHRPCFMAMPAWMVRLAFGVVGEEALLGSSRVKPAKLLEAGFSFKTPDVKDALRKALSA